MNNTKYPATVGELFNMAEERGVTVTRMLEDLGPIPMPPAGYTLAPKSADRWLGPEIINVRWIVTPVWHFRTDTFSVNVWMADHQRPNYADLTQDEATELATALLQAARESK